MTVIGAGASGGQAGSRRYITAALMLVMVLASMEQTITSTAMPTIIGELHGLEHYAWVAAIYLLAATVSMPLYGRLADVLGRKRVLLGALLLFLAASVLSATAHTMGQLIVYRGLQGLGAGGIMPVVLTILGDIFTIQERAHIQGLFSSIWGVSSLAGPWLGASLVRLLGWRSIFFVNLPFGVMAMVVLVWSYHDHEKPHSTDLDLPGAGALALGCICALALVSRLGPEGWSWTTIGLLMATTAASLAYFIVHEFRTDNPIMPPRLMLRRAIGPSVVGSALMGIGFLSMDTYVPLYVQGGRGGGVMGAAGVVTPVMLTWAISGPIAAFLVVKWGFRRTAMLGTGLIICGFSGLLACAFFVAPQYLLTGVLAVTGFGLGPCSMSYLLAAQDAVGFQQRGIITSSVTFFRTMGGAIGIGMLGALFNVLIRPRMAEFRRLNVSPDQLLDPHVSRDLSPQVMASIRHMISGGLLWVFLAMLLVAIVQAACSLLMPRTKHDHKLRASQTMEAVG